MVSLPYCIVDAFTSAAFKGNPAAVVFLKGPLSDVTLQNIAAEFNLSDTAFVTANEESEGRYSLRWFTPNAEMPLCGHATLATAHILFSQRDDGLKQLEFQTNVSGTLKTRLLSNGKIEMEIPAGETVQVTAEREANVKAVINESFASCDPLPVVKNIASGIGKTYDGYLAVEINEDFDLHCAQVNAEALKTLAPESRLIIVTQASKDGTEDFKSRVFAPALGVPEDPVCGSAHGILGPYWAGKDHNGEKKTIEMLARQVSKRYGEIGVSFDHGSTILKLQGEAVTVCQGEIFLPD